MFQSQQKDSDGQYRRSENHDDAGGIHGPQKQWHAEPGKTWGAHLMDGYDEIETGEDRRKAGDENADGNGGHLCIGIRAAVWSIKSPSGIDASGNRGVQRKHSADNV